VAGKSAITAMLGANLFLSGVAFSATTPYRAIVGVETLGLTNSQFALVMTLSAIGAAAIAVLLGYLSDRIRDRRILVMICAAVGALGFATVYVWQTALGYVLAFCLLIPFGNALFSQSFSYSRRYFDVVSPSRAQFMVSILRSLFTAAWVLVPPIAGWLAAATSAFSVFLLAAAAHVLSTMLVGLLLATPAAFVPQPDRTGGEGEVAPVRLAPGQLVGLGGILAVRVAIVLHLTALPLIVVNDLGGTLADVGLVASVGALLEVPFMIGWGYAAMKMSKESILTITSLLFGLYLGLFMVIGSVTGALLLQGLNGIATAALLSITISYAQDLIKGRVGLSTSIMDVVQVASVLGASVVFALTAREGHYVQVFIVGAGLSIVGAALIAGSKWVRRRGR
jgi:MFS transporter, SET family, sugar efflux transporter